MADNCHMSEERKLLEAIGAKNEAGGKTIDEWNVFLLGRIALALAQVVDRLDTLSEALDSFRPRWIEPEEPEMDKKQREVLEQAGVIYPARNLKVYAPAAFSDEAIGVEDDG